MRVQLAESGREKKTGKSARSTEARGGGGIAEDCLVRSGGTQRPPHDTNLPCASLCSLRAVPPMAQTLSFLASGVNEE